MCRWWPARLAATIIVFRPIARVPDFIPALNQQGEIAGYVRYCAIHSGGAVPVYADDLQTVVGHMISGRGFVPGAVP